MSHETVIEKAMCEFWSINLYCRSNPVLFHCAINTTVNPKMWQFPFSALT